MNKYFVVKEGSKLYERYFGWKSDRQKVSDAFKTLCSEFGIETKEFYINKERLHIVPTENDKDKFSMMMVKNGYGEFKKNSPICKRWVELVKGIENFYKPQLLYYFQFLGKSWRELLFDINGTLYGCVESNGNVRLADFVTEIKASEFYKVIEECEEVRHDNNWT